MCITCLMSTKLWSPDRTTSLSFSLHQRIDEEWKEKQRVAVGDLSGIISHRSLNLGDNNNTCLFVSPGRLPPHPPLSEQDCFTLPLPLHEIPASLSLCQAHPLGAHVCMKSTHLHSVRSHNRCFVLRLATANTCSSPHVRGVRLSFRLQQGGMKFESVSEGKSLLQSFFC